MKRELFLKCGLFQESKHVRYMGEESVNTKNLPQL